MLKININLYMGILSMMKERTMSNCKKNSEHHKKQQANNIDNAFGYNAAKALVKRDVVVFFYN